MTDETHTTREPPREWVEALDRAEADLAAGRVGGGEAIYAELRASIKRIERVVAPAPTRTAAAK